MSDPGRAGPRPTCWRLLGLGYAHPGALRAWALLVLGLVLQGLWTPPGPLPWLVFVGDVPLLLLLGRGSGGRWVRWGLLYGFLHYALGFHWLVEIHYGQVLGAGIGLLPVWMAALWLVVRLGKRPGPWPLAVAAIFVLEEIARTWYLGGMPWPTRSLAFAAWPSFVGASAYLGAYALTFVAVLTSAALAGRPQAAGGGRRRERVLGLAGAGALAVALLALGVARSSGDETARGSTAPDVVVAVQGNVPQSLKHSHADDAPRRIFRRHLDLSAEALAAAGRSERRVVAVLWPETMVPWVFVDAHLAARFPVAWENEVHVVQNVRSVAGDDAPPFLLGAIHQFRRGDEEHDVAYAYGTHDSLFHVDPNAVPAPDGRLPGPPAEGGTPAWIRGRHDKHNLVPGGEYTPGGDVLPPLRRFRDLVSVIPELDRGRADQEPFVLASPSSPAGEVRVGTVICFELLFPQRCRHWRHRGADVLVNPSNYGWFGPTAFRAQLRAAAALRAAETATTVVVAGNTGPTVFFDPRGGAYGEFWEKGASAPASVGADEDASTFVEGWTAGPLVVDSEPTPYVRVGDVPWLALGALFVLLAVFRRRRQMMIR